METETIRKQAARQQLRKYVVKKDFTIGKIEIPVEVGDELLYRKGKLELYGQEYKLNNLEVALKAGWIELAEGEEEDPVIARVIGTTRRAAPSNAFGDEEPAEVVQENNGVETLNGVETVPDDWDDLHWTKKRAYIIKLTDTDLLEALKDGESDKMQAIIDKRVAELDQGIVASAPGKTRVNMKNANTGTPAKKKVSNKKVSQDDGFIPTKFGKSTKKKVDMTKESAFSTQVSAADHDTEVAKVFD